MITIRSAPRVLWIASHSVDTSVSVGMAAVFQIDTLKGLEWSGQPWVGVDAVVLALDEADVARLSDWPILPSMCAGSAVVLLVPTVDPLFCIKLLQLGLQDIVLTRHALSLDQRVVLSMERKRLESELRKAHATDLKTGLPNRAQLIEHMSQLLALREREQRPVSVLVLRVEGLQGIELEHGVETANVVRRKVAVRLRAGVRASDVVASLGTNVFGVFLSVMESAADTPHVVDKLVRAVQEPFNVAGTSVRLSTAAGAAQFPADGKQPEDLLRHASNLMLLRAVGSNEAAND